MNYYIIKQKNPSKKKRKEKKRNQRLTIRGWEQLEQKNLVLVLWEIGIQKTRKLQSRSIAITEPPQQGDRAPAPKNPGRQNNNDGKDEDDNGFFDEWLYLSVGLGFAVGILGPLFVLMLKRSWSEAYFNFVDEIVYSLGLERKRKSWGRRNHG